MNWIYMAKHPRFSNESRAQQKTNDINQDMGLSEVISDVLQGSYLSNADKIIDLNTLQKIIKPDQGYLFYMVVNNRLLVVVLSKDQVHLLELSNDFDEIKNLISQLIIQIPQSDDSWVATAQELDKLIIYPLREFGLDNFHYLHIVPDENLRYLPFDLLLDEQGEMMIDKHTINFHSIHSLSTLLKQKMKNTVQLSETSRLSFIGTLSALSSVPSYWRVAYRNLDFQNQDFKGIDKELDFIRSLNIAGTIYNDKQATETNAQDLIENEVGILHMASHGFDNPIAPAFSSLVLNSSDSEDGLLQAREVSKLQSHLSLVVLASCSSAKGGLQGRYGYQLGLAEAFLEAGVKSVIGTLWDVKDNKTYHFMKWFYQFLNQVHQPSVALKLAKQKAREKNWAAKDWAGFIVIGDGEVELNLGINFSWEKYLTNIYFWFALVALSLLIIRAFKQGLIFVRRGVLKNKN